MRYLALTLALIFGFVVPANAVFVEGLEDFPIPDEMEQINESNLVFGNADSRLVEVYMKSDTLNFNKVVIFYKNTLPQLGWSLKKNQKNKIFFERDNETVEISQETVNPLIINLILKSKK